MFPGLCVDFPGTEFHGQRTRERPHAPLSGLPSLPPDWVGSWTFTLLCPQLRSSPPARLAQRACCTEADARKGLQSSVLPWRGCLLTQGSLQAGLSCFLFLEESSHWTELALMWAAGAVHTCWPEETCAFGFALSSSKVALCFS